MLNGCISTSKKFLLYIPCRCLSSTQIAAKNPVGSFGLHKGERRNLRRRLSKVREDLNKGSHIFGAKSLFPWKSKWDLADYLQQNEVYSDDNIIALRKPYGIPRSIRDHDPDEKETVKSVVQSLAGYGPDRIPCIDDGVEILKSIYKCNSLELVFNSERWSSGLIILSKHRRGAEMFQKCIRRSLAMQQPHRSYQIICYGKPIPENSDLKCGITLQHVMHGGKVPVIVKEFSKAKVLVHEVKSNIIQHQILDYNQQLDVSLIELNCIHVKWHFIRVWMAYCLSPIMGDLIYSGRVRKLLKKRILVSPHNAAAYQSPDISNKVLDAIDVRYGSHETIPCHVHLAKLTLKNYSKETDLEINVCPPDYFNWTCNQLCLMSSDQKFEGAESVDSIEEDDDEDELSI